jgi:hypothetical protein
MRLHRAAAAAAGKTSNLPCVSCRQLQEWLVVRKGQLPLLLLLKLGQQQWQHQQQQE